jgi:hypothetical protein
MSATRAQPLILRLPEPSNACARTAMQPDKTTIERAFDLARSGASRTITELIARLDREGCDGHQIQGRFLRKQLTALMEAEANARDGNCSCETRSMAVKTDQNSALHRQRRERRVNLSAGVRATTSEQC